MSRENNAIRLGVSFAQPIQAVSGSPSAVLLESTGIQVVIPTALLSYVSIGLDILLDPMGRNPVVFDYIVFQDVTRILVSKRLAEFKQTGETRSFVLTKGLSEAPRALEAHQIASSRPVFDAGSISDSVAKGFSRLVTPDSFTQSDHSIRLIEKTAQESFYTSDWLPRFVMNKQITEQITSTDDFYGIANSDDDEVMWFQKRLVDSKTISDLVNKGFSRNVNDATYLAETRIFSVSKRLSETSTTAEVRFFQTLKAFTDNTYSTDSGSIFLSNYVDTTYFSSTDYVGSIATTF
jgi:hypothetical protein